MFDYSNFSNYRARFSMPHNTESIMYSFNLGPVHFIGFTTEVYYFMNYGIKTLVSQYEWLEKDLIEANKPENRQVQFKTLKSRIFFTIFLVLPLEKNVLGSLLTDIGQCTVATITETIVRTWKR